MSLRSRLLGSLHDDQPYRPPSVLTGITNSTSATTAWSDRSATEILADLKRILSDMPKVRTGPHGGDYGRMRVEPSRKMPPGWFGLREPGKPMYAGPLPLSSFGIFFREGDVAVLNETELLEIMRAATAQPRQDQGSEG